MYSDYLFKISCVLILLIILLITLDLIKLLPKKMVKPTINIFRFTGVLIIIGIISYLFGY